MPMTTQTYPRAAGVPKRKTLEFDNLQVVYDYEKGELTVRKTNDLNEEMTFSKTEIEEFRAALRSFGMETVQGVTCR